MWKLGIVFLYLLVLSVYDIRECRVPGVLLTLGTILVGCDMLFRLFAGNISWLQSALGSLPGIFLLLVAWFSKKAGYADGIVLLLLGILYSYWESLLILAVSLFFVSLVSIILLLLRKVKRHTRIPYIPFLTAGFALVNFVC